MNFPLPNTLSDYHSTLTFFFRALIPTEMLLFINDAIYSLIYYLSLLLEHKPFESQNLAQVTVMARPVSSEYSSE